MMLTEQIISFFTLGIIILFNANLIFSTGWLVDLYNLFNDNNWLIIWQLSNYIDVDKY